jgi:hypothetical protein
MKFITSLFLISFSLQARSEDTCKIISDINETSTQLADQVCDVINKQFSCAQNFIDPNAQRKKITALFEKAENSKTKYQEHNIPLPSNGLGMLFNREAGKNHFILDFLTYDGKIKSEKASNLKQIITEKYVKFGEAHDCEPIISTKYTSTVYPYNAKYNTRQELEQATQNAAFEEEKNDLIERINSNPNNPMICDKDAKIGPNQWTEVAQEYPPCGGNLSGVFPSNEWKASSLDLNLSGDEAKNVIGCIKDRLSQGALIDNISIESSANGLNNGGAAAKNFCEKGFIALSEARAKSVKDGVIPKLFEKAGFDANGLPVRINARGMNGNGTSGPCPYIIKDGKEILKDEYKTEQGKASLDEFKYVNINVSFKSQQKKITGALPRWAYSYRCREFKLSCPPRASSNAVVESSGKQ